MNSPPILLVLAHAALCGITLARMWRARKRVNLAHMVWIVLMPLFGPVMGLLVLQASQKPAYSLAWMDTQESEDRLSFGARTNAAETVPLEEALLINDPKRRRELMVNVLRTDPMGYLDLLLVARFNEDTETAHYAASTIMELQRQMQLDIQQLQAEALHDPQSMPKQRAYIDSMVTYCESGLLEGQLLRRQRLMLAEAITQALALQEDDELLTISVGNHLALDQPAEAREAADRLLRGWPHQENAWLEALRVAVETKNQQEARSLLSRMQAASIDWTSKGREQASLWMEAQP